MRMIATTGAFLFLAGASLAQSPDHPATQQGQASYFTHGQNGHTRTATGEPVQPNQETAASRTLPLGSKAKVTNKATGKSTEVRINDRGPVRHDRNIDLSDKAAGDIGMKKAGVAPVVVQPNSGKQSTPAASSK